MSFIFSILPESGADLAFDVALILAAVAIIALLIERFRKRK